MEEKDEEEREEEIYDDEEESLSTTTNILLSEVQNLIRTITDLRPFSINFKFSAHPPGGQPRHLGG